MSRLVAILWIDVIVCCTGCYSLRGFKSSTADIMYCGFWSTPRYKIVFEAISIDGGDVVREYEFNNAPDNVEMGVALNFQDRRDIEILQEAGARVHAELLDEFDNVILSDSGSMTYGYADGFEWQIAPMNAISPPSAWQSEPKGKVIDRSDFCVPNEPAPDCWKITKEGAVLSSQSIVTLESTKYVLRIRVTMDSNVKMTVRMNPMLVSGGRPVL